MKELLAANANYHAVISDKGILLPSVEVILVTSEPAYSVDPSGSILRSRSVGATRFASSPDQLRQISERFAELASECEKELSEAIKKSAPAHQ